MRVTVHDTTTGTVTVHELPDLDPAAPARHAALQEEVNGLNLAPKASVEDIHARVLEIVDASWAKYRKPGEGHLFWRDWTLVRAKRTVRTKMGVAFKKGDITIGHIKPRDDNGEPSWTAFSIRNDIATGYLKPTDFEVVWTEHSEVFDPVYDTEAPVRCFDAILSGLPTSVQYDPMFREWSYTIQIPAPEPGDPERVVFNMSVGNERITSRKAAVERATLKAAEFAKELEDARAN